MSMQRWTLHLYLLHASVFFKCILVLSLSLSLAFLFHTHCNFQYSIKLVMVVVVGSSSIVSLSLSLSLSPRLNMCVHVYFSWAREMQLQLGDFNFLPRCICLSLSLSVSLSLPSSPFTVHVAVSPFSIWFKSDSSSIMTITHRAIFSSGVLMSTERIINHTHSHTHTKTRHSLPSYIHFIFSWVLFSFFILKYNLFASHFLCSRFLTLVCVCLLNWVAYNEKCYIKWTGQKKNVQEKVSKRTLTEFWWGKKDTQIHRIKALQVALEIEKKWNLLTVTMTISADSCFPLVTFLV